MLIAACLTAVLLDPLTAGTARPPFAIVLTGSADHRRPVPGETEVVRWRVSNRGARALDRVVLDVSFPAGWRARGCAPVAPGRVRCTLGRLAPGAHDAVTLRLTLPRRPRLGPATVTGRTSARQGGTAYPGPAATFRFRVVRHR